MVDLATDWLGLRLRSPLVVGASPLADNIDAARRLVAAGAGAVVLHSVFEEQIVNDQLAAHRFLDTHVDTDAEARSFLPDTDVFAIGADPDPAPPRSAPRRARRARRRVAQRRHARRVDRPRPPARRRRRRRPRTEPLRDPRDSTRRAPRSRPASSKLSPRSSRPPAVPVTVKLSPFYAGLPSFVARVADVGASGVVVFNRFYQPDIDLDTLDVDRHLTPSTSAELPLAPARARRPARPRRAVPRRRPAACTAASTRPRRSCVARPPCRSCPPCSSTRPARSNASTASCRVGSTTRATAASPKPAARWRSTMSPTPPPGNASTTPGSCTAGNHPEPGDDHGRHQTKPVARDSP